MSDFLVKRSTIDVAGYRGRTIRNRLLRQDGPAARLAIVFPGLGYSKSLGTIALATLATSGELRGQVEAAWLTPTLKRPALTARLRVWDGRSLVVAGAQQTAALALPGSAFIVDDRLADLEAVTGPKCRRKRRKSAQMKIDVLS